MYVKFNFKRIQILFITSLCVSDYDYDGIYVTVHNRGWNFYFKIGGNRRPFGENIVYPAISLLIAVGVMLATGGSAIIAKKMGEKKEQEAREDFSFIVLTGFIIGLIFMVVGNIFIDPIVRLLGSTDALMDYCVGYLSVCLYLAPACILQLLFQTFFVTAGKPMLDLFSQ